MIGKSTLLAAVFTWLLVFSGSATAENRSQRLDSLFNDLASEELPVNAQALEQEIWQVWLDSGNKEVNLELSIGINAMNEGLMDDAITSSAR